MLNQLYDIADKEKINVYHFRMNNIAMSIPGHIAIDTNQIQTNIEEKTILAHELGHCMTGSFYQIGTLETRERMEHRANKWAIHRLVPYIKLTEAIESGIIETYELAEYFEVTEDFIRKAVYYYEAANGV